MDLSAITENLPEFASGAWITIQLTAVSVIIGFFWAVPIALRSWSPSLLSPVHPILHLVQ